MTELIKRRLLNNKIILFMIISLFFISNSCQKTINNKKLECILESINSSKKGMNIIVGQLDGWTDSTALITIIYEKKIMNISIKSELKGKYYGNDIYFNQSTLDSLDNRKYNRIPNNIIWTSFTKKFKDEFIQPPYSPLTVRVEYNIKRNCVEEVIEGKGYLSEFKIKCDCIENY